MSGNGHDHGEGDQWIPITSRPGSVMQNSDNEDNDNVDQEGAVDGDYSNVVERTVANIRQLQDNVCSQNVQSGHVSPPDVAQVEQDNCCLQELVSLSSLRVNLPSPPQIQLTTQPPSSLLDQTPRLATKDPNWQSIKSTVREPNSAMFNNSLMAKEQDTDNDKEDGSALWYHGRMLTKESELIIRNEVLGPRFFSCGARKVGYICEGNEYKRLYINIYTVSSCRFSRIISMCSKDS